MDSSKAHVPVPLPPGLHSVQAGAVGAHPITSVSSGSAFPAVAASPSSAAALQAAREAAALRESYLKNEKKQKCATCGNTARARCPYRSCRTCCMKNNKMCYIHGKTEMAANGSTMMGTAYERYQAAADMAMVQMSPQFRQPAPPTYVQSGAAASGRYQSSASGMSYGPQYYRPPFPGTQIPANWAKVTTGAAQGATHTREQLEYMRLKSYRAAAQAMQKEANALSAWRMRKWKEFDEVEAALEDEAFDRYASSMSWLEELFSVDAPALEGVSEDGHLLTEDVEVNDGIQLEIPVAEESMLSEGFRMRAAANPRKKELTRQKFKRGIDRNLQKLKTKEENVELSVDDDDYNLPVLPLGRHAKRLKTTCKEGRDCIKRMDAFDYVLQKVNDIKSRDDIWRCVNLYKDSFGPAIGCILPHFTRSEDDFLGFAMSKHMKLESIKEPDWMEIDDSTVVVEGSHVEKMVQDCSMPPDGDRPNNEEQSAAGTDQLIQDCNDETGLVSLDKDDPVGGSLEATAVDLETASRANELGASDSLEVEGAGEMWKEGCPVVNQPQDSIQNFAGKHASQAEDVSPPEHNGKSISSPTAESLGTSRQDCGTAGSLVNKPGTTESEKELGGGAMKTTNNITAVKQIDDSGVLVEALLLEEMLQVCTVPTNGDQLENEEQVAAGRDQLLQDGSEETGPVSVEKDGPAEGSLGATIVELKTDDLAKEQGLVSGDTLEVGRAGETEKQGGPVMNLPNQFPVQSSAVVDGTQAENVSLPEHNGICDEEMVDCSILTNGETSKEEEQIATGRDELLQDGNDETDLVLIDKDDPIGGLLEAIPIESETADWAKEQGSSDSLEFEIAGAGETEKQGSPVVHQPLGPVQNLAAVHGSQAENVSSSELTGKSISALAAESLDTSRQDCGTTSSLVIKPDTTEPEKEFGGGHTEANKNISVKQTVLVDSSSKPTVTEQPQTEVSKIPHPGEVARPQLRRNEDIVQPQNEFPAICVCAWRRVDMPVQTATDVLQALLTVDGLEEL